MRSLLRLNSLLQGTLLLLAVRSLGQAPATPGPAAIPTLHATARLVVVDVTVTDGHGGAVHGLPAGAFHLTEAGRPQVLRSVEEHSAAGEAAAAKKLQSTLPPLQRGVFTNLAPPVATTPTILLFDALNTPTASQGWVRRQALNYLRTAPPNTRIAIFGLNGQLVLLQNFTTDIVRLRAAMEGVHPQGASVQNLDAEPRPAMEVQVEKQLTADQPLVGPGQQGFLEQALADFADITQTVNEAQRASMTLRAFHQIALFVAGVPGRKNLIWFSGGFPLSLIPQRTPTNSSGDPVWRAEYRQTMDLLARERIAVYPMDARGLEIAGSSSSVHMESQTAMYEMAEDSGGKAFMNTNGIAQAVGEVVSSGANYYTLAYAPSDANAHGEYRAIRVKIDGPGGYQLSYRRGYFADAVEPEWKSGSPEAGPTAVQTAGAYLAPPATQIGFFARVLPMPAGVMTVADSPRRQLDPAHNRRVGIEYSADVRSLEVTNLPDGRRQAHLEFIALVYDAQGRVVRSDSKSLHLTWTAAQWAAALQRGARYQQEVSVPAGAISLRLLVHDLSNNRLGSLDVPGSSLKPE